MSLLEDLKTAMRDDVPPRYMEELSDATNSRQVTTELVNQTRWGVLVRTVVERDGEYVSCLYEEASGDGECDFWADFKAVTPQTIEVTVYA